jgi:hypothetical protein
MAHPRDFAVSRKSCRLLPLSSESPGDLVTGVAAGAAVSDAATTHGADFVFAFTAGTSKERPEHCDQGAHRQHRDKD